MDKSEVRRLKELERENARLKKLVVELAWTKRSWRRRWQKNDQPSQVS